MIGSDLFVFIACMINHAYFMKSVGNNGNWGGNWSELDDSVKYNKYINAHISGALIFGVPYLFFNFLAGNM